MLNTTKSSQLALMTHVVAGYPDFDTSYQLLQIMVEAGVSYIEAQLPFSDPIGDGAVIMRANQQVLNAGYSTAQCLDFLQDIRETIPVPLCIMTYANIPYSFGIRRFLKRMQKIKVSGLIIPDLPFDEEEHRIFQTEGTVPLIPVVSANTSEKRLQNIAADTSYMLYCTLRVGITGTRKKIESSLAGFFQTIRRYFSVPVIGGFGISGSEELRKLRGLVDVVVVGSHVIKLLDREGLEGAQRFLQEAVEVL